MGNTEGCCTCKDGPGESVPVIVPTMPVIDKQKEPEQSGEDKTKPEKSMLPAKELALGAYEFTIKLTRKAVTEPWGFGMKRTGVSKTPSEQQLLIMNPGGKYLEEWENANPNLTVQAHDEMVQVNGVSGVEKMVSMLKVSVEAEITLRRNVASASLFEMTVERLKEVVDKTGAAYAIWWAHDASRNVLNAKLHYNPPEWLAACRAKLGHDNLFTSESSQFTMTVGKGVIGRVFEFRTPVFIPDTQCLTAGENGFVRKDLAAKYGVKSIAMCFEGGGVLEYGSAESWEVEPDYHIPTSETLQTFVARTGAAYAMWWAPEPGTNKLKVKLQYNPPERVAACKAKFGHDNLFTTESSRFTMTAGKGVIGRVFESKKPLFIPDTQCLTAGEAGFVRKELAAKYDINSIALTFVGGGVLEYGSVKPWDFAPDHHVPTPESLQAIVARTGAAYAMWWAPVPGTDQIKAKLHHNPPERVAESRTKFGHDNLFTTESYQFTMTAGKGVIGRVFESKMPIFIADTQCLTAGEAGFVRKDLAAKYDIKSIALAFVGGGVLEYGSAEPWEFAPDYHVPTSECLRAIVARTGAAYAMWWAPERGTNKIKAKLHYNSPERVAAWRAKLGHDNLFTTESSRFTMTAGTGVIGRVFESKMPIFIADTQCLTAGEAGFVRKELAAKYDIKSIALAFVGGGVMEYGSVEPWEFAPGRHVPTVESLQAIVARTHAVYAMWWALVPGTNQLKAKLHYNPPERVAACKAKFGHDNLFTTESNEFTMTVGKGVIGRVFESKMPIFIPDTQCSTAGEAGFVRKDLAAKYDIKSIALAFLGGGVLEYGSAEPWDVAPNPLPPTVETLQVVVARTGAAYAMWWAAEPGTKQLNVKLQYNPPERVAADKAKLGHDNLFTTESCKFTMTAGKGAIGRVFEFKTHVFIPDTQCLTAGENGFVRKDLAAKYGIKSIALVFMGGGVLEYGSVEPWDFLPDHNRPSVETLQTIVSRTGASYAMWWAPESDSCQLKAKLHYNPPERIAECKANLGHNHLFTTESYQYPIAFGKDAIGKVYETKKPMFIPDVSKEASFVRKNLAKTFGVKSIALAFEGGGVLEYGSSEEWAFPPEFQVPGVEKLQSIVSKTGAVYAIWWGVDKGSKKLEAKVHYNPPERVAACEAFTTESYKYPIVIGKGAIGRVFETKTTALIEDTAKIPANEFGFIRSELAKKYAIKSIAFAYLAGGVLEYGFEEVKKVAPKF